MISKILTSHLRIVLAVLIAAMVNTSGAATFVINNLDGAGEGLNDTTAFTPTGGNPATTVGQARLNVLRFAADIWGSYLDSTVSIELDCNFDPLSCGPGWAVLAQCGPQTVHRDFSNSAPYPAPQANTWYVQALANAIHGSDLTTTADIQVQFNSSIGTAGCLASLGWYYGLDGKPPTGTRDLRTVVLHELAHGLGFLSLVDLSTGAKLSGRDDAYILFLEHHGHTPLMYPDMTDAQRLAASTDDPDLHWIGANALAEALAIPLTAGFPSGHVQIHAPNPAEPGSSISHFSTALTPDKLMEPWHTGADDNLFLALELLHDIGWRITVPNEDLHMRDTPFDVGVEPNPNTGSMCRTQDIYVRNTNDGLLAANQGVHQNPEYSTLASNYVYVRVRNRGDQPASGELKVYWAFASTGLSWPTDWVSHTGSAAGCVATLFGDQITTSSPLTITSLAPCAETIIEVPWNVPNPADYACFGSLKSHFCLLARIETSSTSPYGMTFPEGSGVSTNVRNNNNIVWKNVTVVDDIPASRYGEIRYSLIVRNTDMRAARHNLQFEVNNPLNAEDYFKYGNIDVIAPDAFVENWRLNDSVGANIEPMDRNTWRIMANDAWIGNIQLAPREWYILNFVFSRHSQPEPFAPHLFDLSVRQYQTEPDGTDRLVGEQVFSVDLNRAQLFPFGSVWKYFDRGYLPHRDWAQPYYKDDVWAVGPAPLGFGSGGEETIVRGGPFGSRFITTYFRRTFEVEDPSFIQYLNFRLKRDDGAVAYVNGQEVFRHNMPDGHIDYRTLALAPAADQGTGIFTTTIGVEPNLLFSGANLVAVEIHQNSPTSNDLTFDLELKANRPPNAPEVEVSEPVEGSVIDPCAVEIKGLAIDSDGWIAGMEFYAGTIKVGESTSPPYNVIWPNPTPGTYGITAVAIDNTGLTTRSEAVIVTVRGRDWPASVVTPVRATASSFEPGRGPRNTIDGSGLSASDEHSINEEDMWLSSEKIPQWIHYEFDNVYDLRELWVWNSNQFIEPFVGFGAKDVTIAYSVDGVTWSQLDGVPEFARGTGLPGYTANTRVDLSGVSAKYVRLTIRTNWGGILPACGLSEVRFFAHR